MAHFTGTPRSVVRPVPEYPISSRCIGQTPGYRAAQRGAYPGSGGRHETILVEEARHDERACGGGGSRDAAPAQRLKYGAAKQAVNQQIPPAPPKVGRRSASRERLVEGGTRGEAGNGESEGEGVGGNSEEMEDHPNVAVRNEQSVQIGEGRGEHCRERRRLQCRLQRERRCRAWRRRQCESWDEVTISKRPLERKQAEQQRKADQTPNKRHGKGDHGGAPFRTADPDGAAIGCNAVLHRYQEVRELCRKGGADAGWCSTCSEVKTLPHGDPEAERYRDKWRAKGQIGRGTVWQWKEEHHRPETMAALVAQHHDGYDREVERTPNGRSHAELQTETQRWKPNLERGGWQGENNSSEDGAHGTYGHR